VTGDQHAEWEYTTKGDDNSHDSTSAASSEGKKQSTTVIRSSHKSKEDKQEFVISKMLTQNAHGL